ncbi:conjugation TrbI family protein (plasmid) [Thioalkalivibrio sp. K90mix]|uniref:TrbI/VirB10 family protein n=1 Tax=Thioalkalivibrio sp. (strain K90mix) TaxID=396595 RepID=UPI000195A7B6|nr:TrbI/VirB10 family protein [Thioalkalivibrio sp. K90mix]ADC73311.1 conjugation TrbI family protein [Thioalkalivibrio sp. K90mix]
MASKNDRERPMDDDPDVLEGEFEEYEESVSGEDDRDKPRGKTSKKLAIIIVSAIGSVMALGMMMSNTADRAGGDAEEGDPLPGSSGSGRDFQQEIEEREREALERRRAREEQMRLDREMAEQEAPQENEREGPAIRPDAPVPGGQAQDDGLTERERVMREQAAQSQIVAIAGQGSRASQGEPAEVSERERAQQGAEQMMAGMQERQEMAHEAMRQAQQQPPGATGGRESRRNPNEEWLERSRERDANEMTPVRDRALDRPVVHEGSVIPVVLQTSVNSDLPGMITALTTRDVRDSITGETVVIPRGSRLVGEYNADVAEGQDRLIFAFNRAIFPDGRDIQLGAMQGADGEGRSGMDGDVNTHFWSRLGRAGLIGAITMGAERQAQPANVTVIGGSGGGSTDGGTKAAEIFAGVAEDSIDRHRDRAPTITIDAGTTMNVMVNSDIVL